MVEKKVKSGGKEGKEWWKRWQRVVEKMAESEKMAKSGRKEGKEWWDGLICTLIGIYASCTFSVVLLTNTHSIDVARVHDAVPFTVDFQERLLLRHVTIIGDHNTGDMTCQVTY